MHTETRIKRNALFYLGITANLDGHTKKNINLTANNCVNCNAQKFNFVKITVKYSYINTLNVCVTNFQPQRLSDYEFEHFDDFTVQPENSY